MIRYFYERLIVDSIFSMENASFLQQTNFYYNFIHDKVSFRQKEGYSVYTIMLILL